MIGSYCMKHSPTQHLSDEALAEKAREDVVFLEPLIERYEPKLRRYIMRISSFCPDTVDEILQEIFLKLWKNLNAFRNEVKFSSWIYRIAHNETISTFRRWQARGEHQQTELDDSLFVAAQTNLTKELDVKLSGHNVQKVLQKMPEKYREILVLKFLEDLSYDEISDILHMPGGTVATRINRAKKSFQDTAKQLRISFHT